MALTPEQAATLLADVESIKNYAVDAQDQRNKIIALLQQIAAR